MTVIEAYNCGGRHVCIGVLGRADPEAENNKIARLGMGESGDNQCIASKTHRQWVTAINRQIAKNLRESCFIDLFDDCYSSRNKLLQMLGDKLWRSAPKGHMSSQLRLQMRQEQLVR